MDLRKSCFSRKEQVYVNAREIIKVFLKSADLGGGMRA